MDLLDRLKVDIPVVQAGMGGMAPAGLAAAVARAGGLGTIGMRSPTQLRIAIDRVRQEAPGRAVAVNLLMPFASTAHIDACVTNHVDVAVVSFGGDAEVVQRLRDAAVTVFVLVGSESQARTALDDLGADGVYVQGQEAGGHLAGTSPASALLPRALAIAEDRPVFLAGGVATATDTRAALDAGAAGVVAGTRFLLTDESAAHPAYQQRILSADRTMTTTLFGLGWPARHRVVPNEATQRWCRADGTAKRLPTLLNARSARLSRAVPEEREEGAILRLQRPGLPFFSPAAPTSGLPDHWIERCALYAGDSVLRMNSVVSAAEAVALLAG